MDSEGGYARAIFKAGRSAWGRAALEVGVVTAISLVPLLAGVFREMLVPPLNVAGSPFERSFLSGQLIFYAVGLIATVAWQSNKDWRDFFPWRSFANLICIVVIGLCCIAVGADPTLQSLDRTTLAVSSVILFAMSILMYLFMALVGAVHPNLSEALAQSDVQLTTAVKKSRGLQ